MSGDISGRASRLISCCFIGERGDAEDADAAVGNSVRDDSMVGASFCGGVGCLCLLRGDLVRMAPIEAFVMQFPIVRISHSGVRNHSALRGAPNQL